MSWRSEQGAVLSEAEVGEQASRQLLHRILEGFEEHKILHGMIAVPEPVKLPGGEFTVLRIGIRQSQPFILVLAPPVKRQETAPCSSYAVCKLHYGIGEADIIVESRDERYSYPDLAQAGAAHKVIQDQGVVDSCDLTVFACIEVFHIKEQKVDA